MSNRVSNRFPKPASVWLAAAVLLVPALAGAQLLDLVSQERRVRVEGTQAESYFSSCIPLIDPWCEPDSVTVTPYSDEVVAPGAGPFVATAAAGGDSASQDSQIGGDAIHAAGGHEATASFSNTGGFPITYYSQEVDVTSRAEVVFDLDAGAEYTLSGSLVASALLSVSSALVRLTGPEGVVAEVTIDVPYCADPGCYTVGPVPVAESGVLGPGTYTLEIEAAGTASGVHSTIGSFGGGVEGDYDVVLQLSEPAVPALPAPALGALALLLGAAARRRLCRAPATRLPSPAVDGWEDGPWGGRGARSED